MDGAFHQRRQPVFRHQHFQRRFGGAAGAGDRLAQSRGGSLVRRQQCAGARYRGAGEFFRVSGGRPSAMPASVSASAIRNR